MTSLAGLSYGSTGCNDLQSDWLIGPFTRTRYIHQSLVLVAQPYIAFSVTIFHDLRSSVQPGISLLVSVHALLLHWKGQHDAAAFHRRRVEGET